MNEKEIQDIFEREKERNVFTLLNSKEELRNWVFVYLDIEFPMGHIYPGSNSSPIEAMWRIYELIKTGETSKISQVVIRSGRDCYKTASISALKVLIFAHFRLSMAIMSAQKGQSEKCIQYINSHFRKISGFLENKGWKNISESKSRIEWVDDNGDSLYIKVIVASRAGANSDHLPIFCIDEIDLIADPIALEESKMIPSSYKGLSPITIGLSTLKYSGGLMESFIKKTKQMNGEVFQWNIIDVTERIPDEQLQKHLPMVKRHISKQLPMENISVEQFEKLNEKEKERFEEIITYAGIAEHPMLSVMKNYLAERPREDYGGLFKKLFDVHNNFKGTSEDMATAQLLCLSPSTKNLVYPKFDNISNTLTVNEAYERLFGEERTMTFDLLIQHMKSLGITFYAGADWGFNDLTSLVVLAVLANGDVWLIDCFSSSGLELDDIIKEALPLQQAYNIKTWYCDTAYPAYLKTFNRKGMKAPTFEKDVSAGIVGLQRKICDSFNKRSFFIIKTKNNEQVIDSFEKYRWKFDAKGDPTDKPEHTKNISDIMDSIRYPFQILFSEKNKVNFTFTTTDGKKVNNNNELMKQEIEKRVDIATPLRPSEKSGNKSVKFIF